MSDGFDQAIYDEALTVLAGGISDSDDEQKSIKRMPRVATDEVLS